MRERKNTMVIEMDRINQLMRGLGEKEQSSCFIDAWELQDSADKSWLADENYVNEDYSKFGTIKKINF